MTRETSALFAQSASALAPFLSLQTCLCSPLKSRYASGLSLGISIPTVSSISLFPALSCHAGPPLNRGPSIHSIAERQVTRKDEGDHTQRRPTRAHDDQEGSGPTCATARHKCRTGQLFQLRTETAQFIRQEGAFAARQAATWARKMSATSNDGNGMLAYEGSGLFFFRLVSFKSSNGLSNAAIMPVATLA
jgi:hypothetical protein